MGDGYEEIVRNRGKAPRDVDVVEWAILLAFFLVGITALAGTLYEMLS